MATDINLTPTAGMPPVTTVTSGSGSEQVVPSDASVAALADQQAAARNLADTAADVVPTVAATVEGKAAASDLISHDELAANNERSQLIKDRMPAIKEAQRLAKDAESRYENHQFYDYLSKRSAGDKIMSRIAIAVNAGANAYLGIPGNELAEELQHRVDKDFEVQKIALHNKENIAKWKREGVTDLYGQLQTELANLDVKHAKALEATKEKAVAM